MKKKITTILLVLALLTACGTQAPAAPPTVEVPDIETIIRQSVDEAVQEKTKEYEEEQKKKDQEIAELKAQIENLAAQSETPPEGPVEESSAPSAEATPTTNEAPSQAETPPQPESKPPAKPEPEETTHAQSSAPPSSYDGFDLKNMYPSFVWENITGEAEEVSYTAGCLLEEAQEAIRLANQERENHGLDSLPIDDGLMELAGIRAEEIRELYSHTRPDGTSVVDLRCGENVGQRRSAEKQVTSWMNSEGHRTNILLERYHHIGAACYQAENGNCYWVMVFSLD